MAEDGEARAVGNLVEYSGEVGASRVVGLLVEYEPAGPAFASARAVGNMVEYQADPTGVNRAIGILLEYSDIAGGPLFPVPPLGYWNDTWIALWETTVLNSGGTLAPRLNAHFEDYTRTLMNQCITLAGGTPIEFMAYNDFVRQALAELVTAVGGTPPDMYEGQWEDVVRAAFVELVDAVGGTAVEYQAWNDHILRMLQVVAGIGV